MQSKHQKIESKEEARAEHYCICKAMIEKDTAFLVLQYGSLMLAEERLGKLDYFLNYNKQK